MTTIQATRPVIDPSVAATAPARPARPANARRGVPDPEPVIVDIGRAARAVSVEPSDRAAAERVAFRIDRALGQSGIGVAPVAGKQVAADGFAPGSLLVANFTFRSGGSTYVVTAGQDGTLVGTKDGQAWQTWRISPPRITQANLAPAVALAALQRIQSSGTARRESGPGELLTTFA